METRAQIKASCMEMKLIWESELPYYSFQRWWYGRGEIVELPRVTKTLLLVKVEPHGGYYTRREMNYCQTNNQTGGPT